MNWKRNINWMLLGITLLCTEVACANPVSLGAPVGFALSLFIAHIMESIITGALLCWFGMRFRETCIAVFIMNLVLYFIIFCPLLRWTRMVVLSEVVITMIEAAAVLGLSMLPLLQGEEVSRVTWRKAITIAAVGNLVSFGLGVAM